jgi:hypothetical protein
MMPRPAVSQSTALLAVLGAAIAGFLAGGAFKLLREAPAAGPAATPTVQDSRGDGSGSAVERALRRLNSAHLEQRALLANSVTSGEQARVATELALGYALTARELARRGKGDGAAARAVTALEQLAEAYDRLAATARDRDAGAFAEATTAIGAREERLRALLRALTRS